MTGEQLRELHRARPFQPFQIHMAGGQGIDVNHPENLAYGGGRTCVVFVTEESSRIIDLLLIASLETITGQGRRRASGRGPRS